jgi:hypothetical protein
MFQCMLAVVGTLAVATAIEIIVHTRTRSVLIRPHRWHHTHRRPPGSKRIQRTARTPRGRPPNLHTHRRGHTRQPRVRVEAEVLEPSHLAS